MSALPLYQCHKKVRAAKIVEIAQGTFWTQGFPNGSYWLHFDDEVSASVQVPTEWCEKHSPKPGGYYVLYEDGYQSFSPAKAFEEGYSLVEEA